MSAHVDNTDGLAPVQREAARLLAAGLFPVVIGHGQKRAIATGWQKQPAQLEDFTETSNLGLGLGQRGGFVFDVDYDYPEAAQVAALVFPAIWPDLKLANFGRGGRVTHSMFVVRGSKLRKEQFLMPGARGKTMMLELRGDGHQTMIPPSTHPDGELLSWFTPDGAMPTLPEVKLEDLKLACGIVAACTAILTDIWPGNTKDDTAAALAGTLAHGGVPEAVAQAAILALCDIGGSDAPEKKLSKVRRFYAAIERERNNEDGGAPIPGWTRLAELVGDDLAARMKRWLPTVRPKLRVNDVELLAPEAAVDKLNSELALNTGEKMEARFIRFRTMPDGEVAVTHHTAGSAADIYAGEFVPVPDPQTNKNKVVPVFDYWRGNRHKRRREVDGYHSRPWSILDAPDTTSDPRRINVFPGWGWLAEAARMGNMEDAGTHALLDHIVEGICAGDAAAADYLLNWLAHGLHAPGEKPKTAIVMAGQQGTGKSLFLALVAALQPPGCSMVTSEREQLFGRFNIHLLNKQFVGGEELVHGGNHREDNALKDRVTCDSLSYEAKGQTPFVAKNYTRYALASNSAQPVSTESGKRRYLFLAPSTRYTDREHKPYWKKLAGYIQDRDAIGGLVRLLVERDISEWNPAALPTLTRLEHIDAAQGVDRASDTVLAFVEDLLVHGEWHRTRGEGLSYRAVLNNDPDLYKTSQLYEDYREWLTKRERWKTPVSLQAFATKLIELTGKGQRTNARTGALGEHQKVKVTRLSIAEAREHYAHARGYPGWPTYEEHLTGDDGPGEVEDEDEEAEA